MTKEEFFKTVTLPYYSKTETSYYKIISEEDIIYVSDIIEIGIMISPFYFKSATSENSIKISANEFEIKYMEVLNKLKAKM